MSLHDALEQAGIRLTQYTEGVNHKTLCPHCSASRKKAWLKCLSVKIEANQAVYVCFHCGAKGVVNGNTDEQGAGMAGGKRNGRGGARALRPVRRKSGWL